MCMEKNRQLVSFFKWCSDILYLNGAATEIAQWVFIVLFLTLFYKLALVGDPHLPPPSYALLTWPVIWWPLRGASTHVKAFFLSHFAQFTQALVHLFPSLYFPYYGTLFPTEKYLNVVLKIVEYFLRYNHHIGQKKRKQNNSKFCCNESSNWIN